MRYVHGMCVAWAYGVRVMICICVYGVRVMGA